MDLFDQHLAQVTAVEAPLAARMRPLTLDEFVGQDHILGQGRLLRRAISLDQLSSLIFYGPPGTGKTTLARVIANTTRAHFIAINAVLSGVKEIRAAIETAQEQRKFHNRRTILFVDEVHRFNKSQQDALLPWVENGTVILIGATTENPYFEVNKALVSRSRIFQLKPLQGEDLYRIVEQTLNDSQRGYGKLKVQIDDDALAHLVNVANGDARSLLNALELAVETTSATSNDVIHITLAVAEESIQQRAVLYDKEGDAHFDTISAFIKSLRGSDPDAALYWLAKMVYAGEDPRFIFRRMLILASEDVGLADPNAVVVVNACAEAFDRVGMPEGRYHLAQATLYLATAPKSNSIMGFFDALAAVESERSADIPNHLKDANRDKKGFGHGAGYLYPHAYRDHWVAQQYLPASLQGQVFYQPSMQGLEEKINAQVASRREAQLAALVEGMGVAPLEILTYSSIDRTSELWLQRTLSQVGTQLAVIRDHIFTLAQLQRHHLVLDLNAGSGLLTWEAIRRVGEGGVYACVNNQNDALALIEQAAALPELMRPVILNAQITELPAVLASQTPGVIFDYIIGRNVLFAQTDKASAAQILAKLLPSSGKILLAESIPRHTQRLYRLIEPEKLDKKLYQRLVTAEEAIYSNQSDPMLNWDAFDLQQAFEDAGLAVEVLVEQNTTPIHITPGFIERLFRANANRPSYGERLAQNLTSLEIHSLNELFMRSLLNQTVSWMSSTAFVKAAYKI
ncbi:recombination factor protein RarA/unknown domain fusion protein (plasmid) [Tolypothrix tenuis PCC 7101]|uniref:Replication-associated recombination protein A n=1 Tax=Tolypothrix tenuis PCC 7101 TaxID=231146 RepID=A0A1Z4NB33_9CYAN|nr:AAA family ATPase [Aulosira sp. FACHB-113]BAZ02882.1 recombination factor protein RarA/unknown domain fusion protein [Tolypothrix tenuis PCC 7101]BAZ78195.1 recombination factor protein RarA/unknown domain fusion protein [Aulosira laxa NIES-50]